MIRNLSFGGSLPVIPHHLLGNDNAQYAKDVEVRHGELRPLKASATVMPSLPTGTSGVFTNDGHHIISSPHPLYASLSPTVGDVNDRVYYTSGDSGLRVCKWSDAGPSGGIPASWKVGVPAPTAALTVRKVRKNRWPNYPNTQIKATLFLESENGRHFEESVTLTQVIGSIPYSKYSVASSTDVFGAIESAKNSAKNPPIYIGDSATIVGVSLVSPQSIGGVPYPAGVSYLPYSMMATVAGASVSLQWVGGNGDAQSVTIPAVSIDGVVSSDGSVKSVVFSAPDPFSTQIPESARVGMEVWLENQDNAGERIWTVYTTTSSSGSISQIPGGGEVTLRSTGPTSYEINITFGVIEDRSYVYTMVNDWQEESMPSDPAIVSITYLDDVVLQVDYDACVSQLSGYRPLDHLQFYRATNGTYVGAKVSPALATDVESLYTNLLGRDSDTDGLAYWTAQYNSGMSLSEISAAMMSSREYTEATGYLAVEDLYLKLLNRQPEDAGFAYWSNQYASGVSLEKIALGFIQSTEFVPGRFASIPSVSWFYDAFLSRAPDSAGLAYWMAEINSRGALGYATMVSAMLMSSEYRATNATRHVTYMLTRVYGSAPTSEELAAATAKYNAGFSLNAITADASAISQDGFKDEGGSHSFTLQSLEWNEPAENLTRLTALPNGVFAAAVGSYVYFSEPYRPFAWPAIYGQAIPNDVVSLISFDGQLLVTTTGSPLMIAGAHPEAMTQQRIGANEAASSEFGLAIANGRPVYAAKDGLVTIEGLSGSLAMSNNFFSAEVWRSKYGSRASDIVLVGFDSRLIGMFPSGDGFIINMGSTAQSLVEFSQAAGYPFRLPGEEALYIASPGIGRKKLFFGDSLPYIWRSKEFIMPSAISYGAVKVVHDGNLTIKFFADGVELFSKVLAATGLRESFFRLPAKRFTRFSYRIESSAVVQEVHIARNMRELANA